MATTNVSISTSVPHFFPNFCGQPSKARWQEMDCNIARKKTFALHDLFNVPILLLISHCKGVKCDRQLFVFDSSFHLFLVIIVHFLLNAGSKIGTADIIFAVDCTFSQNFQFCHFPGLLFWSATSKGCGSHQNTNENYGEKLKKMECTKIKMAENAPK